MPDYFDEPLAEPDANNLRMVWTRTSEMMSVMDGAPIELGCQFLSLAVCSRDDTQPPDGVEGF